MKPVCEPRVSIHSVSFVLPDGRTLFENLSESFGPERAALVGRNGAGKTVLAKIVAGLLEPSSGSVVRDGDVFYLDQMMDPGKFSTVSALAGLGEVLEAVRRAERGEGNARDLESADGGWDVEDRLTRELNAAGLRHLTMDTPALTLSGGECTRVLLAGAFLSGADFLILDEPTNHLDAPSRRALTEYLNTWRGGLLVVTHDRELLGQVERIVELSSQGLKSYGGDYSLYAEARERERQATLAHLAHVKTERRRTAAEQQASIERQRRRTAQGKKRGAAGDMPKALLHMMRRSAEKTAGKLSELKQKKTAELAEAEKEAFLSAGIEDPVILIPPACSVHGAKVVLRLEGVMLPYGTHQDAIDWTMTGPERAAVEGANGSGKTTLLRVLRSEVASLSGGCEVRVPYASLGQFADIDEDRTPVELVRAESKTLSLSEAGTRLVQIGLARERLGLPARALSGGERLKLALLCAIHRDPPPQLLILDEPTNHLDLDSVESVEKLLNAYTGALIVVSHDACFLERIGVTQRIRLM
ncbi:MAG: ATP-binding cassette domain-containing protein [Synergistaceae bacterium]|nr:ATP-binding cassette domain-containing protein [Synergistaceae bacterium]